MTTVPAHSLSAPIRAWLIAAARVMPGVCAVFKSSWFDFTTRTPWRLHFDSTAMAAPRFDVAPSPSLPDYKLKSKRYFVQPPRALIFRKSFNERATMSRIYVIHENDAWVEPLRVAFAELRLPFTEWFIAEGKLDLDRAPPQGVFYNRMSASSHTRGHRYAAELTEIGRAHV